MVDIRSITDHLILPLSKPEKAAGGKTGTWRVFRPVIDAEKCIKCQLCWMYCPDATILTESRQSVPRIDYEYCKGCLVCYEVCPVKAIHIERES